MPKSHPAPGTPTVAEREASAARPIIRNPLPPPANRAFLVLAVVTDDGTIIAEFPPAARADANAYATTCGGWVAPVKTSRPARTASNPPAPPARRKPEPPASVRVESSVDGSRVIPCDNRQDAVSLAERIAEHTLSQRGGLRRRDGNAQIIEWKYTPAGADETGRRFAERLPGLVRITVHVRGE